MIEMKHLKQEAEKHIIDSNKLPSIPYNGWTIESHEKMGKIDVTKLALYLTPQQEGGWINGSELNKSLKGKGLNATILDYLLEHPELIPEDWKGKYVYFHGTVYRNSDEYLYVRYLYFGGGHWQAGGSWLDSGWGVYSPAVVSASMALSPSKPENSSDTRLQSFVSELKTLLKKYDK